ncbi:MAG: ATP:cob(I)alamin adenosyltransferase [Candidatus Thorarchaeota archaeon]|jgi:ATP:cob(I)alamin adenosyltransferase
MSKHIYTRKGDKGKTGLLSGERVGKDNPRVEAYGTVDELITVLGIAKSHLDISSDPVAKYIHHIQQLLFYVAAELATNPESVDSSDSIMSLRRASAGDNSCCSISSPSSNSLSKGREKGHNFL